MKNAINYFYIILLACGISGCSEWAIPEPKTIKVCVAPILIVATADATNAQRCIFNLYGGTAQDVARIDWTIFYGSTLISTANNRTYSTPFNVVVPSNGNFRVTAQITTICGNVVSLTFNKSLPCAKPTDINIRVSETNSKNYDFNILSLNLKDVSVVSWSLFRNKVLYSSSQLASNSTYSVSNLTDGDYSIIAEAITVCQEKVILTKDFKITKLCEKPTNITIATNINSKYTFKITGITTDIASINWRTTNATGAIINQLTNNNANDFESTITTSGTYTTYADVTTSCGDKISYKIDFNYTARTFSLEKVWDKSFGGNGNDGIEAMALLKDGGTLLAGWSDSQPSGVKIAPYNGGLNDFWIIKVDASWGMNWQKGFGGTNNELLLTMKGTADGGALIGGLSNSDISGNKTTSNNGDYDYWVMKIDASGNKQWERNFGGTGTDYLKSITITSDGGAILGGYSSSNPSGNKTAPNYSGGDYWVVKIDGNGNQLWDKSFGGSGYDDLNSVNTAPNGDILLGGTSQSSISGNKTTAITGRSDAWLVKLNSQGSKIWEKSFGGIGNESINAISFDTDGSTLIGGNTGTSIFGTESTESDFWLLKIDTNGNALWEKRYGGNGNEAIKSIAVTSEGSYILGGYSSSSQSGSKTTAGYGGIDYWVVKVDTKGNKLMENTFGGSGYDELSDLYISSENEICLGGKSDSDVSGNKTAPNYGQKDYWIVKIK